MNIITPLLLRSVKSKYYVKGGRAYDIFFKNKSYSLDWDINTTQSGVDEIIDIYQRYADEHGLKLIINTSNYDGSLMYHVGIENHPLQGDVYIFDIVVGDKFDPNIKTVDINGVSYIPMSYFFSDLLITQYNRFNKSKKYYNDITNVYLEEAQIFYGIPQSLDIDTVENVFIKSLPFLCYSLDRKGSVENKILIPHLKNILAELAKYKPVFNSSEPNSQSAQIIDYIRELESQEEDILSRQRNYDMIEWFDLYKDYLDAISNTIEVRQHIDKAFSIYKKTRIRYNNLIDLSWSGLSDEYKIWLLSQCQSKDQLGDIELFNISPGCRSFLRCVDKTVHKSTHTCLSDKTKDMYDSFDDLIKKK